MQASELEDLAQVTDHLGQPLVACDGDDGLVDRVVGGVVIGDAALCCAVLQLTMQRFERSNVGITRLLRSFISTAPFKQSDDRKNVIQVLLGDLVDKTTPPGLVPDQAFCCEHFERFTQRCARNGELFA